MYGKNMWESGFRFERKVSLLPSKCACKFKNSETCIRAVSLKKEEIVCEKTTRERKKESEGLRYYVARVKNILSIKTWD